MKQMQSLDSFIKIRSFFYTLALFAEALQLHLARLDIRNLSKVRGAIRGVGSIQCQDVDVHAGITAIAGRATPQGID